MDDPIAPEPDVKDWTWAITRPCPECGFDPAAVSQGAVPALVRAYPATIATALAAETAAQRPQPAVWSTLEYGCHVRDVCRIFLGRLELMLGQDDPQFENWDQDATALRDRYWEQDPRTVAGELEAAAASLAEATARIRDEQWQRPGHRSNGSVFTVDTFARYLLHDLAHHAWDVRHS